MNTFLHILLIFNFSIPIFLSGLALLMFWLDARKVKSLGPNIQTIESGNNDKKSMWQKNVGEMKPKKVLT